jgi:hypothetical protein
LHSPSAAYARQSSLVSLHKFVAGSLLILVQIPSSQNMPFSLPLVPMTSAKILVRMKATEMECIMALMSVCFGSILKL